MSLSEAAELATLVATAGSPPGTGMVPWALKVSSPLELDSDGVGESRVVFIVARSGWLLSTAAGEVWAYLAKVSSDGFMWGVGCWCCVVGVRGEGAREELEGFLSMSPIAGDVIY